ncbi:transporter substrate-binding domain-containing protein [Bosea sp. (in: a-proteobacteria)]|uniref:transporter substrate-binding domain-containing protein n=1 Tax=Bosea sp. (in: a-proteobacteria) TaxID=1871050 RepID=UPI001AC7D91F|nr:transporter substrate-binding domain-containing protein [Bosea sp. (in: a-proteobacteria)]MBN9441891.1 transporter substrate-binding domain-containing protein [Bosea sp. (in: a-proteobacteria)]
MSKMATIAACLLAPLGLLLPLQASAQGAPDTLAQIKKAGVIKVGMADSVPAQQKNPISDKWEGFNVDMAKNLADALGVKLEIVDATWSTIIPSLMQKQYDIAMVDMFRTPARAVTVDFTDNYMTTGNTWLVSANVDAVDWKQLDDPKYTIVSIAGMAAVAQSQRLLPKAQQKTIVSDNAVAGQLEVAAGRASAHLSDLLQNALFMKANPNAKVKILGGDAPIEMTGYAYAVRPGDYHFLSFLNTWITYNTTTGFISDKKLAWYGIK